MFKSFLVSCLFLAATTVHSEPPPDPERTIESIEVTQIELSDKGSVTLPSLPLNPLDQVAMYVDGIIALGQKVWPIIEAGKPVVNLKGMQPSLSVLPRFPHSNTHTELYDMENWSQPKAVSYRVSFKNWYKKEVIGFTYTLYFQYNGSYQGNGKYITSLLVQASEVTAAWGFKFDASTELVNIANVGTAANPVASAIIRVSYKGRALNESGYSQSFYVDGNGNLKALNK